MASSVQIEWKEAVKKPIPAKVVKLTNELWSEIQTNGEKSSIEAKSIDSEDNPPNFEIEINGYKLVAAYINEPKFDGERHSDDFSHGWLIQTLEDAGNQLHQAKMNDYLICGNKGEIWAIDQEVFEETYEWLDENTVENLTKQLEELC